jgi:hypothetical protein
MDRNTRTRDVADELRYVAQSLLARDTPDFVKQHFVCLTGSCLALQPLAQRNRKFVGQQCQCPMTGRWTKLMAVHNWAWYEVE